MGLGDHTSEIAPKNSTSRRRFLRGFGGNQQGSAAIEFAALVFPFLLLVFAILESCISFAAQQMLASATDDMARQFRTGQIRPADVEENQTLVRDAICRRIQIVVTDGCPGLEVDLKVHSSFQQAAGTGIPFTTDGDLNVTGFGVEPGESGAKSQLRVFYRWPVITDLMRKSMSNLPNGKTLLFAMVTWQNEPFDDE